MDKTLSFLFKKMIAIVGMYQEKGLTTNITFTIRLKDGKIEEANQRIDSLMSLQEEKENAGADSADDGNKRPE